VLWLGLELRAARELTDLNTQSTANIRKVRLR
jgi:hypothetical protein